MNSIVTDDAGRAIPGGAKPEAPNQEKWTGGSGQPRPLVGVVEIC
jgi:hypothetical protein